MFDRAIQVFTSRKMRTVLNNKRWITRRIVKIPKIQGNQEILDVKLVPWNLASVPKPENCSWYPGKISKIGSVEVVVGVMLSLLVSYTCGIPFSLGIVLVVTDYFGKHSNHFCGPLTHLRHITAFFLSSSMSEEISFNSTLLSFLLVVIPVLFLFFPNLSCREWWPFLSDLGW